MGEETYEEYREEIDDIKMSLLEEAAAAAGSGGGSSSPDKSKNRRSAGRRNTKKITKNLTLLSKYAFYFADEYATDTNQVTMELNYKF